MRITHLASKTTAFALIAFALWASLPIAAQGAQELAGNWRMTYPSEDRGVVIEFIANLRLGSANTIQGDVTARACERESLYPEMAGAADENMAISGSVKGRVGTVSLKIPSCGLKLTAEIKVDTDTGRLLWAIKSGSPGPSYVPTKAELTRLDYDASMEEAAFYDGQQDFKSALMCYYQAVAAKPMDVEANYNVATNLAILALYTEGPEAEAEEKELFPESRAVYALRDAIALDAATKERAAKDPSWGPLRNRISYLCTIGGFELYDWPKLGDLLKAVGTWYEASAGVGPGRQISFKKGGAFIMKNFRDEDGELSTVTGLWSTSGDIVSIRVLGGETEELSFGANSEWDLVGFGNFFDHQVDQGGM